MNYTEFMNAMLCEIRGQVDAQVRTELYTVTKNNGTRRTGILFKQEDSNLAPTIYLEEFYRKYLERGSRYRIWRIPFAVFIRRYG